MTFTPPLNGGRINATISGNTAGAGALVSTGTVTLAGGNNITLSQAGNAITISAGAGGAAGTNTFGMSNLGNTSGTTGVVTGSAVSMAFAGGNNITLSQSINAASATITVSAANQTNQNLSLYALGNTTQNSSTLLNASNLSYNGLGGVTVGYSNGSVQISGPQTVAQTVQPGIQSIQVSNTTWTTGNVIFSNANGMSFGSSAGGGVTASYTVPSVPSQTNQTLGLYALGNTTQNSSTTLDARTLSFNGLGMITAGYSNGSIQLSATQSNQNVSMYALGNTTQNSSTLLNVSNLSFNGLGGNTIGFSNGSIQISGETGAGGGGATVDYYQNMDRGTSATLGTANGTLFFQRLNQENAGNAANITANTVLLNMSGSMTATSQSSSHSFTVYLGIYKDNTTNISLLNSASTSWGFTAATSVTANYNGPRWLSFVSSQWSSAPVFVEGSDYVFGLIIRSSNFNPAISWIGQNYMVSAQRSGTIGTTVATNASMAQGNYWNAMYTATTLAFPTAVSSSQVNRNNATAIFMPHIVLNNRYSGTF